MPVNMEYSPQPDPYREPGIGPQDSYDPGQPSLGYGAQQEGMSTAPGSNNFQPPPAGYMYPPGRGRARLEYIAMALIVVGTVLIGTGMIVLGTAPGDIDMGEGEYSGHSSSYISGYNSGYYDGRDDQEYDEYHGYSYEPDEYSGDSLSGYRAGYDDGYQGRSNAMNNLDYHPDIRMGAVGAGSILTGTGVILEGLGIGFRIKAHFDQVKLSMGL